MRDYSSFDKMQEECGVFGIFSNEEIDLSKIAYISLSALQHRGQESCGIAIHDGKEICCYKDMGLVSSVFLKEALRNLRGKAAIGHIRYSTSGDSNLVNAQPILNERRDKQMAVAHNGNIANASELKKNLVDDGIEFQTSVDSEVILKLIETNYAHKLENSIDFTMKKIDGGYSVLLLTEEKLIGFRDPKGIRPLCIGKLENSFILCSESCAIDAVGGEFIRDVEPGEIVIIDSNGLTSCYFEGKRTNLICAFEYIYFARPDSVIDNLSVYEARVNIGKKLWEQCSASADLVIGVPESGTASAIGYSIASGIPYGMGFVKNAYIGRTFIEPTLKKRETNLGIKLSVIKHSVEGKRVVVIDDSIVRGTTSKKVISLLRNAGAKEIHFRVASPIIKYPCFYGINTQNASELLGNSNNVEDIRKLLGVESLGYISLKGLKEALFNKTTCLGCFSK